MPKNEIMRYCIDNKYILMDGRVSPRAKKKLIDDDYLQQLLSEAIPWLDIFNHSFAEMKHCVSNNIQTTPKCVICDNTISFDKSNSFYPTTCSKKCSAINVNKPRFEQNNPAKHKDMLAARANKKRENFLLAHPELKDKEWLIHKHTIQHFSITELSTMLGVTPGSIRKSLREFDIPTISSKLLREASNQRTYGVNNVGELPAVRTKALATLVANRSKNDYKPSVGEYEVLQFVRELLPNTQVEHNVFSVISPKELDIYIPDKNIAIEYNGLYWHSEQQGKNKWYHHNKWKKCNEQGIQLITIFEDEWTYKKEQVKSKLAALVGCDTRKKVFARKCKVVEVSVSDKTIFFDQHHIQGSGPGSINVGLEYGDELIACMSFIKQAKRHYLNRYATSHRVVGGFGKLLTYFQREYDWETIISFADNRWSNGNLYHKTGWNIDIPLKPDYSYASKGKRIHKFNYRRKFLPSKLAHFDPNLSEWENCKANGVLRIWDCGKQKFKITK